MAAPAQSQVSAGREGIALGDFSASNAAARGAIGAARRFGDATSGKLDVRPAAVALATPSGELTTSTIFG